MNDPARPKVAESLQRQSRLLGPVLIVLVAVFHLTTLRSGHDWGGDFALYILHGQNIVEGDPYAQTPYIYNPYYPELSPRAYPPVYPLMLAPLWAAYGGEPLSMKAITRACSSGSARSTTRRVRAISPSSAGSGTGRRCSAPWSRCSRARWPGCRRSRASSRRSWC